MRRSSEIDHTPKLSVLLLEVAQLHHQLLTGNTLLIDQLVPGSDRERSHHQCDPPPPPMMHSLLCDLSEIRCKYVCIRCDTSNTARHVSEERRITD